MAAKCCPMCPMPGWTTTRPRSATKSPSTGISTSTNHRALWMRSKRNQRTGRGDCRLVEGVGEMSYFARSDELPAWVADVPESWGSDWLKWRVRLSTERPSEEEQAQLPYISNEDIASWTGKLLKDEPQPAESEGRKFQTNDVLLNKLRPYLAKVYHADFDG